MIARVRDVEPRTWAMTALMVVCFAGLVLAVVAGEWTKQVVVAAAGVTFAGFVSYVVSLAVFAPFVRFLVADMPVVLDDEAALLVRQNKGVNE